MDPSETREIRPKMLRMMYNSMKNDPRQVFIGNEQNCDTCLVRGCHDERFDANVFDDVNKFRTPLAECETI